MQDMPGIKREGFALLRETARRKKAKRNNTKPKFLVAMRLGETPVPIPNTTVKTQSADGTALETVWESRWAPDQKENNRLEA